MTVAGTSKANLYRPMPQDPWPDAFDLCRQLDRPIYAEIKAAAPSEAIVLWKLFPSGRADKIDLRHQGEPITFHRRNPLRPRGGNQFYRDRSERAVSTVCGAPVTEYDAAFRQRGNDWARQSDGQEFIGCRECWPEVKP